MTQYNFEGEDTLLDFIQIRHHLSYTDAYHKWENRYPHSIELDGKEGIDPIQRKFSRLDIKCPNGCSIFSVKFRFPV